MEKLLKGKIPFSWEKHNGGKSRWKGKTFSFFFPSIREQFNWVLFSLPIESIISSLKKGKMDKWEKKRREENPFQSPSCYCSGGTEKCLCFHLFLLRLMDFSFSLHSIDLSFAIKRFIHEWHENKCPEFNRFPINVASFSLCMNSKATTMTT